MRAAVTRAPGVMELVDVPEPGAPEGGEVLLRPDAVGLCGSDFHYFRGELGFEVFPRIQGHEFSAVIEAVGPDCPEELGAGQRVAVWPVRGCGHCYPCRIGRENVCVNLSLVGVHRDGALQGQLRVPATQVFPLGDLEPAGANPVAPASRSRLASTSSPTFIVAAHRVTTADVPIIVRTTRSRSTPRRSVGTSSSTGAA